MEQRAGEGEDGGEGKGENKDEGRVQGVVRVSNFLQNSVVLQLITSSWSLSSQAFPRSHRT